MLANASSESIAAQAGSTTRQYGTCSGAQSGETGKDAHLVLKVKVVIGWQAKGGASTKAVTDLEHVKHRSKK